MPPLLFPNHDALRLVLASGMIPGEVARGAVVAGLGEHGEVWLTAPVSPQSGVIPALHRFGVRFHTAPRDLPGTIFPCWAAALPLVPERTVSDAPAGLFRVPVRKLARFAARLRRDGCLSVAHRIDADHALVLVANPPQRLFELDDANLTAYRQAAADIWVRHGWAHPLAGQLTLPPNTLALVDPPHEWRVLTVEPWAETVEHFAVAARHTFAVLDTPPRVPVSVALRLKKCEATDATECLWVLDAAPSELVRILREMDERLIGRLAFARIRNDRGEERIVLRPGTRKGHPVLPPPFRGFVVRPTPDRVHVPSGFTLAPNVRPDRLADMLKTTTATITWIENANEDTAVYQVPVAAFRPLAELIEYTAPPTHTLTADGTFRHPFTLPAFDLIPDATRSPGSTRRVVAPPKTPTGEQPSWLGRLTERLFHGSGEKPKAKPERSRRKNSAGPPPVSNAGDARLRSEPPGAMQKQLERAVLERQTSAVPAERWGMWVELASVQRDGGQPADAAVCWVNAIWDHDPPPRAWVTDWLRAEARSARLGPNAVDATAVTARPNSVQFARLAAALVTEIGLVGDSHTDAPLVTELVRQVNQFESELPVRCVWLARTAAARLSGGDPLGLAHCRDRLLARLATNGPAVDLDAPSFLRFHGGADGEQFRAARDWLHRVRDPINKWVHKHASDRRLGWAGLDPDPKATAAYADLMLAWGLSRLGDRSEANEWAGRAEHALTHIGGPGVDRRVHTTLLARFRQRIRAAQNGHTEGNRTPDTTAAPLGDSLGSYAVEKLTAHSAILMPLAGHDPYRGHDLDALIGTDPLGERLTRLLRHRDPHGVAPLLAEVTADATASVLPRTVFAVAELADSLDAATADQLLRLFPRAVELMPEAVRMAVSASGDTRHLLRRFAARGVASASRLATRHDLTATFDAFAGFLVDAISARDEVVCAAVADRAAALFGALHKLGLKPRVVELLAGPTFADRAVAWLVAGREDVGMTRLDAARDRLFVSGIADERERTTAAFDYVDALAHAPPRFALGRLEELFQRLDRIAAAGGTARYYALKPLELIDRAVTTAISEEFTLGPAVRRWLEDDEFLIRKRIARDVTAAVGTP